MCIRDRHIPIGRAETGEGGHDVDAAVVRHLLGIVFGVEMCIRDRFQSVAVGKSRQSISSLMDIRPDYANVEDEDGKLEQVDPDDVEVGTCLLYTSRCV